MRGASIVYDLYFSRAVYLPVQFTITLCTRQDVLIVARRTLQEIISQNVLPINIHRYIYESLDCRIR